MRGSNHKGRTNKKGQAFNVNHNDRNYTSDIDKHINKEKTKDNIYLVTDGSGNISELSPDTTLKQHERRRYAELFYDTLCHRNDKALKQRHPERVKDIDMYLEAAKTAPDEEILQIGKEGEYQDEKTFLECVKTYIEEHQKRYPNIAILDAAIHVDETSIHCHLRKVYVAIDKDGYAEANQHKCLESCGYELPDKEKKRGQYNNLKMPYSEDTRLLWLDVAQEKNKDLDIERTPAPGKKKHKELLEYQVEKINERIASGETIINEQNVHIEEGASKIEELDGQLGLKQMQISNTTEKLDAVTKQLQKTQEKVDHADHELQDKESKLEDVSESLANKEKELKAAEVSAKRYVGAYNVISKGAQNHERPSAEVAVERVQDGIFRSHEEYCVKIPCEDKEQAVKLQKEIDSLYDKHFAEGALNQAINAKLRVAKKKVRQQQLEMESERQQWAREKEELHQELEQMKTEALQESQLYRSIKSVDLGLDTAQLKSYLKDSVTQSLVNDTVLETIRELEERGMIRHINPLEKLSISESVISRLANKIHDFVDRVKEHFAKRMATKARNKGKGLGDD